MMMTKAKLIKDMARLKSLGRPTLAKKNIVVASRRPNPPIETGSIVIALIMGMKIKKYNSLVFAPKALAVK